MGKAKILCVDNDHPTVTIVSGILRHEGYDVEVAYDGHDGMNKAQAMVPDLIIMDIELPDIDGYEVCRQLSCDRRTRHIGVLVLTAKGDVDTDTGKAWIFATILQERNRGFDSGALEFMSKPVKAKELTQRVKAVLWMSGIEV